jgi:GntR family transcriptional regulator
MKTKKYESEPIRTLPPERRLNDIAFDAPLYKEVRRRILEALARGEWQPGERLPNETELATRFGVAVSTVRAGVAELAAAGVLVRRQGKGTFVTRHDRHGPQFRFSNIYDAHGKVETVREITSMRRMRADRETAALLGLTERTRSGNQPYSAYVHRVDALLQADGRNIATMELLLPCVLFPKLRQPDLERTDENLYAVYQSRFGITVLRMEERITARNAQRRTAHALGVKVGHPLLLVERVAYSFNNRPVEIRRRLYEGLGHHYLFTHESLD